MWTSKSTGSCHLSRPAHLLLLSLLAALLSSRTYFTVARDLQDEKGRGESEKGRGESEYGERGRARPTVTAVVPAETTILVTWNTGPGINPAKWNPSYYVDCVPSGIRLTEKWVSSHWNIDQPTDGSNAGSTVQTLVEGLQAETTYDCYSCRYAIHVSFHMLPLLCLSPPYPPGHVATTPSHRCFARVIV